MEEKNNEFTENTDSCTGTVKIADEVVGMIASLAATEVEGVHGMAGTAPVELLGKVGVKAPKKGFKVEVKDKTVRVYVSVILEYGYNIPTTCQKVQEKIKNAIENMTGLKVADVDVRISGIMVPAK